MDTQLMNEAGQSVRNPSGGIVWLMLADLNNDDNTYLIMSDIDDEEDTYMYVGKDGADEFRIEYQVPPA